MDPFASLVPDNIPIDRMQCCIHESGHFICGFYMGIPGMLGIHMPAQAEITYLVGGQWQVSHGRVRTEPLLLDEEKIVTEPEHRKLAEDRLTFCMTGVASEKIFGYNPIPESYDLDMRIAYQIVDLIPDIDKKTLLERAQATASELVNLPNIRQAIKITSEVILQTPGFHSYESLSNMISSILNRDD